MWGPGLRYPETCKVHETVSAHSLTCCFLEVMGNRIDFGVTFKHAKEVLKARSWKPSDDGEEGEKEGDRLYWLDGKIYRRLDEMAWRLIFEGARARL